ncbi:MAG: DsbA family protein [Treponema sp.]|jgi:predicted DsbA family dithiol-disulfide isomerase|nr:DsbA family protein [Treponema sp.]
MKKLQVFFDYECPYCKRGYEYFTELAENHPEIAVEWRPIESHPRPEDHPPHTDLACAAYYAAVELGADMKKFFAAMFQAVAVERRNVEKAEVLTGIVKDIVDADRFRAIIESGKYAKQVEENNDLAYEKSGVWFVPAFRMEGKKLDAKGGAGVSREELREFLAIG